MAKQTVTLRLDEDDLTYLARIELAGASNLSEKIRSVLAEARLQREGLADYGAAYDFARRLFGTPERDLRQAELRNQLRSELVARVLAWLPETAAYVLSGAAGATDGDEAAALKRFERGLGERVLGLTDSVLQLARAGFPGCYAPGELERRATSAVALAATPAADRGDSSH